MIFKRLSISIDSRDFWTCEDGDLQGKFVRAIERGVNYSKHIKMAERLIPDDVQDMLKDVPVMLISMAVDDAVHEFADFSYYLRDADYDIGAMFACHTDPDICGIVIPVERLHDPYYLRHSIVHELVHYNQWKRGDFQADPEGQGLLWKGELYTYEYLAESDKMSFSDSLKWQIENLPWEDEAYGSCDQMDNAGRDERELYYWLCDHYRQEPEDYDKYWSKKDNYNNYLSALKGLDGGDKLMPKKRKLEDLQAEKLDSLSATDTLKQLNAKVAELTDLLNNHGHPKDIACLQKEVDELNTQAYNTTREVDVVNSIGDAPLFEEGEMEEIANKAIAEVNASERHNRSIDMESHIKLGAQTLAEVDRTAMNAAGFASPSYDTALIAGELAPFPVQPVYVDEHGTKRFKPNPIIKDLQESGALNLNEIAGKYPKHAISQLNQLIGYSVDGWWYLSTTSQMDKVKAQMQEKRLDLFDSIDGEINYLRKDDHILPIDAIHVTQDAEQFTVPIELPILFQRITTFDGHYALTVHNKSKWEVEWVDSSFHGHCSYNLDPNDEEDGCPEFPVGTINLKVNANHLLLEKIGEEGSGVPFLTFDWGAVAEQMGRSKTQLPASVNFGLSKLLTNYGTFTKQSADYQGIFQMCQAVLRFMASRKFILDNLSPEIFEPELYAKLYKAIEAGPVKDNTAVNKLLKATRREGVRGKIQTAFKHIAESNIDFEESRIHLETDRAVYDGRVVEIEQLIKQYL